MVQVLRCLTCMQGRLVVLMQNPPNSESTVGDSMYTSIQCYDDTLDFVFKVYADITGGHLCRK